MLEWAGEDADAFPLAESMSLETAYLILIALE